MAAGKISRDDVERLSRGLPTQARIGSRGVPYRLSAKERILFEVAKKNGYLSIPLKGTRENLVNVYLLWCQASGEPVNIYRTER